MFKKLDGSSVNTLDMILTDELELGYRTAQFDLPYTTRVKEEEVIDIDDYLFVVKELDMTKRDRYTVHCHPYFGDLKRKRIDAISGFGYTAAMALDEILEDTGWTYELNGVYGAYAINLQYMTVFDAIEAVKQMYQLYIWYDTKAKKIMAGSSSNDRTDGAAASTFTFDGANAFISCKSDTYDLCTRLIPIGKDKLTIGIVNDSKLWVENHQFSDDTIVGYYINNNISNPDALKAAAEAKLKDLSREHVTYTIKSHLLSQELKVGDIVRIIDHIRERDVKVRVQKKVINVNNLSKSYIEVGDVSRSFDKIYKDYQAAQDNVNKSNLQSLTELNSVYR